MYTFKFLMPLLLCLLVYLPVNAQPLPASDTSESEQIGIGLLLTEDPENSALMREAGDVAILASEIVNEAGGIGQKAVKIVIKSVDGNWGAGSKQAVNLIYEHQATALLGFVDGRSAHLIEQVCTKAEIPFISALSPDPSLSQINIPWFFSTLPLANQQAAVLAEHLFSSTDGQSIRVVASDDYDQKFMSQSFLKLATDTYQENPAIFRYTGGKENFKEMASSIARENADALVFFGSSDELHKLAVQLSQTNVQIPVYTPVMDLKTDLTKSYSGSFFTLRDTTSHHLNREAFKGQFYERYGYMPGNQTAYLYEGLQLLFHAIQENGDGSELIRETLSKMKKPASFDSEGVIEQTLTVIQVY